MTTMFEQRRAIVARLLEGQIRLLDMIVTGEPLGEILDELVRQCEAALAGGVVSINLRNDDRGYSRPWRPEAEACPSMADPGEPVQLGSCSSPILSRDRQVLDAIAVHAELEVLTALTHRVIAAAAQLASVAIAQSRAHGTLAPHGEPSRLPDRSRLGGEAADKFQGYYFSRPLPAHDFEALLRSPPGRFHGRP